MKDTVFLVFCELLTVAIVATYGTFRAHFAKDPNHVLETHHLRKQIEQQALAKDLLSEDFAAFRAYVAVHLPEALRQRGRKESGYGVRTLASLTTTSDSEALREGLGQVQFVRGRSAFRAGDYETSKNIFKNFISQHPYSPDIIEAHFLLMETESHLGQSESAVQVIEKMTEQYPHSELTGFAMLKLASYFEQSGHRLEASQLYRTILKSFPYHDVAQAAGVALRSMEP
jgi:TolA-binding protein